MSEFVRIIDPSGKTLRNDLYNGPPDVASYIIFRKGGKYYAKDGEHGHISHESENAKTLIESVWDAMPNGGTIFIKGQINTTQQVNLQVTQNKALTLIGESPTKSVINFSGSGYALRIYSTTNQHPIYIANIGIDCQTKTSGRHGLKLEHITNTAQIDNIKIKNADTGLHLYDATYTISVRNALISTCNTGVKFESGSTGGVSNVLFINPYITHCANYGFDMTGAGHTIKILGGEVAYCGTGVYLGGAGAVYSLDSIEFDHNTTVDIDVHGTNDTDQVRNVNISNCLFASSCAYAIKSYYVRNLQIINPDSHDHTTAFLWYDNRTQRIIIIDPSYVTDPYLLDGSPTTVTSRNAGIVITPKAIGFIAAVSPQVSAGDVVYLSGDAAYGNWNPAGNEDNPAVVLYGNTGTGAPAVLVLSGIAQVNCEAAVTRGDTLVVADGTGNYLKAEVNNTQTDPKKIIGYAIETTASAGLAWAHIK